MDSKKSKVKKRTWIDSPSLRDYLWMEFRRRFDTVQKHLDGNSPEWPKNERRPLKYNEFIKDVVKFFQQITGQTFSEGSIQQQIDWGLTSQQEVKKNYFITWIGNLAAAEKAGVISTKNFPAFLLKSDL